MNGMTLHAKDRIQQRGISKLQLELIHFFGDDHYQKGGCCLSYVSNKKLQLLRKAIDNLSGVQIVKTNKELVLTAMHRTRRTHTTEYAA